MGKKPVVGIVGAFCVGLALTGCRDANTRSDAPPQMTKATTSPYKAQPTFGPSAPGTASQANGWNVPPTAAKTDLTAPEAPPAPALTGAGSKPMDSMSFTTPASPGVQPAGGAASGPIGPPPDSSSRFGPASDVGPAVGATSSNFPPAGDVRAAGGRMLPPTPAMAPAPMTLPPLPTPEAPTPSVPVSDAVVPPPPSSLSMSPSALPSDLGLAPAPSPAPVASPSPLPPPAPGPMLPPPPPSAPRN